LFFSKEPVSLKEIMDEQLAIHVSQSDQVSFEIYRPPPPKFRGFFGHSQIHFFFSRVWEKKFFEEQLDLSTKLKRSRLHGMFPSVDPLALNEIFQANRCVIF
jgi:hypothetical protein